MLPRQADYYYYYNRHSDLSDDTMLTSTSSSNSSTSTSTSTVATDCTSFRSISIHTAAAPPAVEQQHVDEHKKQSAAALLGIQDFRILKPIGAGDIGKVYLCQLRRPTDDGSYYAMKVMDRDVLELKKKTHRAEMEKEILKLLNHPFLPNVIAQFEASRFSCNVIDYCSGGDLHSLRHRLPNNRFSLSSARFYAAEVLMGLEYLHMLGIVYRDLKPENILVRGDGHIMLTDFDLCLRSTSTPTLQPTPDTTTNPSPSQKPSCLPKFRSKKVQTLAGQRTFVAEPTSARSSSFVGTHEYVAPEVASGNPHGSPVDWWAFGIFLYEMLYGRTPFAGESNEITLRNIVKSTLTFPNVTPISSAEVRARDLIAGLLNKDAANRLGSKKGAAEIKSHGFFKGVNFALIRSITPPEIPGKGKSGRSDVITAFDCF